MCAETSRLFIFSTCKYKHAKIVWGFSKARCKVQHKHVVWGYILQIPFTWTSNLVDLESYLWVELSILWNKIVYNALIDTRVSDSSSMVKRGLEGYVFIKIIYQAYLSISLAYMRYKIRTVTFHFNLIDSNGLIWDKKNTQCAHSEIEYHDTQLVNTKKTPPRYLSPVLKHAVCTWLSSLCIYNQ